jgi:hypothetical protein
MSNTEAKSFSSDRGASSEAATGIREFLLALQARNKKDNGLYPQCASEVEADARALDRILKVLDFYHPPRQKCPDCSGTGALKNPPAGLRWPLCDKCAGSGRVAHPKGAS